MSRKSKVLNLLTSLLLLASIALIVLTHFGFFTAGAQSTQTQTTLQVVQSALNQYAADREHYPLSQEITTMEELSGVLSTYVQGNFFLQSSLTLVSYQSTGNSFVLKLTNEETVWTVTPDLVQQTEK